MAYRIDPFAPPMITPALKAMHEKARVRFKADMGKCYQRHIREMYGELEKREQLSSLSGAVVSRVTNEEARTIIEKYEWLQKMGSGTVLCYGLFLNGELLGVACFGVMGGKIRQICVGHTEEETRALASKTICFQRGACVPWAPKNAASFLINKACFLANKEHGWKIFFAYSDSGAGEIGTVYQASNWLFIGAGSGRPVKSYHSSYVSPDGQRTLSSYTINHGREKLMKEFGVPRSTPYFRTWLSLHGWVQVKEFSSAKGKYVWFEGSKKEKETLKSLCRYPFLPYPKRG